MSDPVGDRPLRLVLSDLGDVPEFPVPEGHHVRRYGDGDEDGWAALQEAAEPNPPLAETTHREFARVGPLRTERCLFLVTDEGRDVGTITAWHGRRSGAGAAVATDETSFRAAIDAQRSAGWWGMPAWLAVHPDHQGRRLAQPLLSAAMRILRTGYGRAIVRTTSGRPAAIKRFLEVGFTPDLTDPEADAVWSAVWDSYPGLREHCRPIDTP